MQKTRKTPPNLSVGSLLKKKRIEAGYGPSAIAAILGVAHSTILNYEAGRVSISRKRICEIAQALDIDPLSLLNEVKAVRTRTQQEVESSLDRPNLLCADDPHALSYHIEEWDGASQKVIAIIGSVDNATIALATFTAAVAEYPWKRIHLRLRRQLIATYEPHERLPDTKGGE